MGTLERHIHVYLYRSVLGCRIQKSLLIVLIFSPKNADVSKTYFLNNSSLDYGRMMKFGPKLHLIKRIIFKKNFLKFCWRQHFIAKFRILLISSDVSKIWKKMEKCSYYWYATLVQISCLVLRTRANYYFLPPLLLVINRQLHSKPYDYWY